jgi:spartin
LPSQLTGTVLSWACNLTKNYSDPVEITISADGKRIDVKPLSEDYLEFARHPAYQSSSLVQNAAAASRLIVTTSSYIAGVMTSSAESFQQKTKPQKPVTFSPATHTNVRKISSMTQSAAQLSSKTVSKVGEITQNVGATLTRRGDAKNKGDKLAQGSSYKPGILNKSMIAFSTIGDGIAVSAKNLLHASATSTTAVVGHRYGEDARKVATQLTSGVTNVGLVYIDVTGVSRRAVIKSVAKGMVVGRVKDGRTVMVGAGDGGDVPAVAGPSGTSSSLAGLGSGGGPPPPGYDKGDYKGPVGEKSQHQ